MRDSSLIEELGIGYAPGGNLRRHLAAWCSSFDQLNESDYGSIITATMPSRGGSFHAASTGRSSTSMAVASARRFPTVYCWLKARIVLALRIRQQVLHCNPRRRAVRSGRAVAGPFRNTTCAIGTQLTPAQLSQVAEQPGRSVYVAFDQDDNKAGQKAAHQLPPAVRRHASTLSGCQRARSQQLLRRRSRHRFYRPSAGSGPGL